MYYITKTLLCAHDVAEFSYTKMLNIKNSVDERIFKVATSIILLGMMKSNLNLAAISVFTGMAFHEFCNEKTSNIWSAIFKPTTIEFNSDELDETQLRFDELDETQYERVKCATINLENFLTRLTPVVFTGTLCFLTLPVVGAPAAAIFAGLKVGSYFGKNAFKD